MPGPRRPATTRAHPVRANADRKLPARERWQCAGADRRRIHWGSAGTAQAGDRPCQELACAGLSPGPSGESVHPGEARSPGPNKSQPRVEGRVRVLENNLKPPPEWAHLLLAEARQVRADQAHDPSGRQLNGGLTIIRPVVDFPQPDSPTSPSVRPKREKLTSKPPGSRRGSGRRRPDPAGKAFTRFSTFRISRMSDAPISPLITGGRPSSITLRPRSLPRSDRLNGFLLDQPVSTRVPAFGRWPDLSTRSTLVRMHSRQSRRIVQA